MSLLVTEAPPMAEGEAGVPISPYPGLRPFSERESRFFFGRESEIASILALLEERQLVVVHGASGCGKSSVVRAGVMPIFRLDAMANSMDGRVIIIRPADLGGPLQALARKLEKEFPRAGAEGEEACAVQPWSTLLAVSPNWAEDIGAAVAAAGATLCIVLDQFEEIFAVNRTGSAAEVRRIIDFLTGLGEPVPEGTALGKRSLSVIVTMRSDYLGHCAIWDGFAEAVNRCQYLLPKISTVGLLRAIHEPARRVDAVVTEDLADSLMPVIAREIDGLPILQHALMRAWYAGRRGANGCWTVDADALEAVGGAEHALSRHAEETYAAATGGDHAREEAADWIFRSLSDLDSDGRIVRRSASLKQLVEETGASIELVRSILAPFRDPASSLVMPFQPEELDQKALVSISHEALLRQWLRITDTQFDKKGRATGLVYREFQDGLIWRSLAIQAQAYAQDGTSVLGAAATEQRLPWYRDIEKRPGWIARHAPRGVPGAETQGDWSRVADFMAASERNLRKEQELVARLRRNQRLVGIFSIAVVVLTVALAMTIITGAKNKEVAAKAKAEAEIIGANRILSEIYAGQIRTAEEMAWRYCNGAHPNGAPDKACVNEQKGKFIEALTANRARGAAPPPPSGTPGSPIMGGLGSPLDSVESGDKK